MPLPSSSSSSRHHHLRPPLSPLLLLLLLLASSPSNGGDDDPSAPDKTVYEVLRAHGLPIGLLPRGVKCFRIDEEGRFEVRLDRPCSARFENEVRYDAVVTGNLSYGQIGALSGISAQELFLWFPVKGIRVDVPSSGFIYFDVGVVHKQFPLSLFDTPPECRADPPSAAALRETAPAVGKSKHGNLRYDLDQEDTWSTVIL